MRNRAQEVSSPIRWRPSLSPDPEKNSGRLEYLQGDFQANVISGQSHYQVWLWSPIIFKRDRKELANISAVLQEEFLYKAGTETGAATACKCYIYKKARMMVEITFDALHVDADREACLSWIYFALRSIEAQIKDWE